VIPFWWKWSSWSVELLGGALLAAAALAWTNGYISPAAAACLGFSVLYEFVFDSNADKPGHKPWADIGQRAVGSAIVLLFYSLVR
jgi:hypothetical protein